MSNDYNETLNRVAEETFESLAFMISMPEDEMIEAEDGPKARVRVSFAGPVRGDVLLAVSADMLPELAVNMLGTDMDEPAPPPAQQADALGEVLNVICGNLLPAIAGSEAVFDVAAPVFLGVVDAPDPAGEPPLAATTRLALDSGWAEITLFLAAETSEALT